MIVLFAGYLFELLWILKFWVCMIYCVNQIFLLCGIWSANLWVICLHMSGFGIISFVISVPYIQSLYIEISCQFLVAWVHWYLLFKFYYMFGVTCQHCMYKSCIQTVSVYLLIWWAIQSWFVSIAFQTIISWELIYINLVIESLYDCCSWCWYTIFVR